MASKWFVLRSVTNQPVSSNPSQRGFFVEVKDRRDPSLSHAAGWDADLPAHRGSEVQAQQHFLYFFPLPHGQGSLRPILLRPISTSAFGDSVRT